ncbi:hypothetical protein K438DRAFT_1989067 [Mycena galopus ATCC 62051]|nr:hypothetical protein K438DRAFT_1989067 [Mycena galopus ATCC 62051]
MADAVPLAVVPAVAPFVTLDELQPKAKVAPLSMTALVATGNEHLSLLAVSSIVESRMPSPRLANGIKREASPLAVTYRTSPPFPLPLLARGGPLQTTVWTSTFATTIAVTWAISILRARSFARGTGDPPWVGPASHSSALSPLQLVAHVTAVALCVIFRAGSACHPAHRRRCNRHRAPTPSVAVLAAQCAGCTALQLYGSADDTRELCRSCSSAPIGGEYENFDKEDWVPLSNFFAWGMLLEVDAFWTRTGLVDWRSDETLTIGQEHARPLVVEVPIGTLVVMEKFGSNNRFEPEPNRNERQVRGSGATVGKDSLLPPSETVFEPIKAHPHLSTRITEDSAIRVVCT